MAKYRISQKAIADLGGIWKYTAETWSEEQADRYYVTLQSTIQQLSNLPNILVRKYDSVKNGRLGYRIGHHIIFYTKQADGSVWIDRILHEKMDFQRQFFVPAGSVSKYIETWPKYASRIFSQ